MSFQDDLSVIEEENEHETRRCGNCGHYDEINQCCWVIADDGICRDVTPDEDCVFGWPEE